MNINRAFNVIVYCVLGTVFIASMFVAYFRFASASAPSGLNAGVATSSPAAVTGTASTIFATSSPNCAARIITTYASPIMLTFTDRTGLTPTGTFGHLQAASTTVAYDSGLFGCDAVKAYSFVNQTITLTETR